MDPTPRQLDSLAALWQCRGSSIDAARMMGISPQTFKNTMCRFRKEQRLGDNLLLIQRFWSEINNRRVLPKGEYRGDDAQGLRDRRRLVAGWQRSRSSGAVGDPGAERQESPLLGAAQGRSSNQRWLGPAISEILAGGEAPPSEEGRVKPRRISEASRQKQRDYAREYMRAKRAKDPKSRNLNAFYDQMVARYGEQCAICGKERSQTRRLCIDHSHATDEVRGLLCFRCNNVLGWVADSVELLAKMASYLEQTDYTFVSFAEVAERGAILPEQNPRTRTGVPEHEAA